MSFSKDAKIEVLNVPIVNDCCAMAYLSGLIKSAGQLGFVSGKKQIEIYTELENVFDKLNEILNQYYGCVATKEIEPTNNKTIRYKFIIPSNVSDEIMIDLGIVTLDHDGCYNISNGIAKFLINDECCKVSYVRGVFVGCATSNIVIKNYNNDVKNTSGYHFEFVFGFEQLAEDFVQLLDELGIQAKITIRKNSPIVYIKEYQVICDILALVGASKCVCKLQNEATIREVRNNVNRQNNCFSANLNKTLEASIKQLDAIDTIKKTIGIESLAEPLQELCLIRLANPDEPLDKLRLLYSESITKSGINHRFQKIMKIADKLKR